MADQTNVQERISEPILQHGGVTAANDSNSTPGTTGGIGEMKANVPASNVETPVTTDASASGAA